jgi:hypothetical protein
MLKPKVWGASEDKTRPSGKHAGAYFAEHIEGSCKEFAVMVCAGGLCLSIQVRDVLHFTYVQSHQNCSGY